MFSNFYIALWWHDFTLMLFYPENHQGNHNAYRDLLTEFRLQLRSKKALRELPEDSHKADFGLFLWDGWSGHWVFYWAPKRHWDYLVTSHCTPNKQTKIIIF